MAAVEESVTLSPEVQKILESYTMFDLTPSERLLLRNRIMVCLPGNKLEKPDVHTPVQVCINGEWEEL